MAVDGTWIDVGLSFFEMSLLLDRYEDDLRAREAKLPPVTSAAEMSFLTPRRARLALLEDANRPRHHDEIKVFTLTPVEMSLLLYGLHYRQGMLDAGIVATLPCKEALGQAIVRQERNRDRIAVISALLRE